MSDLSDEQLICAYLNGDDESFEILVRRYLKSIYAFIYRYVERSEYAEDITQDTFVRVWKNCKKFDQQRSFKTWIFSIAKNASLDFLKRKKTIPFSHFENENGENVFIESFHDETPLPSELFERKETANKINVFLERLSPPHKRVLFLYYKDQLTFQEISDSLGESLNTIKSRHRRALLILRKMFSESFDMYKERSSQIL